MRRGSNGSLNSGNRGGGGGGRGEVRFGDLIIVFAMVRNVCVRARVLWKAVVRRQSSEGRRRAKT